MKKIILFAAVLTALTACNNGKTAGNTTDSSNSTSVSANDSATSDSTVYVGTTPAADCDGIRYRLAIANDSTMEYSMTESYMKSDKDIDTTYFHNGKAVIRHGGKGTDKDKSFYILSDGKEEAAYNFRIVNDSTIRMVNKELEDAVTNLEAYDLKIQQKK